jgi:hypothetical protein
MPSTFRPSRVKSSGGGGTPVRAWRASMTAHRIAFTVIPAAREATVRYRKPPMVGASPGVVANHARTAGRNGLSP